MTERKTKFILSDDETEERLVNKGLPQGGVLSPTLYNIYTSELSRYVRRNVQVLQYADDTALYTICENVQEGKTRLKRAIREVDLRLNMLGLEIEPFKTNVML